MPVYNRFYFLSTSGSPAPGGSVALHPGPLFAVGPQIPVNVQMPQALASLLTQQQKPVPNPISGVALLDTGASISAVDATVIQSLGVSPVGVTTLHTPSGTSQQNQYPVRFEFPGSNLPAIETQRAIGSLLQQQGIIALIGRDVLASFVFVYNGPGGFITLAF